MTPARRWITLALTAVGAACGREAEPALRVAGVSYAEEELLGLSPSRRATLAALTAFGVAVARDSLPSLGRPLLERRRADRLAELLRAELALDSVGAGDDALRARYLTDPDLELTVRHLIVLSPRWETEARREEARRKALGALERIRGGEPFEAVAAEVSEEPGAESRQGLLEPGREGAWVSEFWNAAAALEPGQVSGVVETRYGFHVLRLEDRETVPFEDARNRVLLASARLLGVPEDAESPLGPPPDLRTPGEARLAGLLTDPEAPDGDTVATWAGASLTLGELRDHLAALERAAFEAALDPERPPSLEDVVEDAARREETALSAGRRGLVVGDAWDATIVREWTWAAEEWARTLGFRAGVPRDELKEAALGALGATGQTARLARNAVEARLPLVWRRYQPWPPGPP